MAALPTLSIGADDEGKQEYLAALKQVVDSLQMRNQPNLFSVAGALLDPGRTGNVGEAIGRAGAELGRQQEAQEQRAPGIAMMKAQVAAQKYELGNQSKALGLLAGVLGVPEDQALPQLQSGSMTPDTMSKLVQVYPMIAQLSPKVGEIVKGSFNMQNELRKAGTEEWKAGTGQAENVAKYGPQFTELIPGGGRPYGPQTPAPQPQPQPQPVAPPSALPAAPQPAPEPSAPAPAPSIPQAPIAQPPTPAQTTRPTPSPFEVAQAQQMDKRLRDELRRTNPNDTTRISELNTALDTIQKQLAQFGIKTAPISGAQPSDTAGLPLGAQAEVGKKRVEESDKPYNAMRDSIINYTPQLLEGSNTNLRQLDYFARTKPQIFGIMQQQGLLSGLMTAAQEGAQLTAGDFHARLGLPVKQFLEKVKLSPEDQQSVRDVSRILGTEFLANVRANKGLLGVNPTDNDARLLQAPMASIDDSSKAVQHWARQQILLNKQREALYNEWQRHADTAGAAASPRQFFKPGSPYEKINKDYADYRMRLFKQFHPE